MMTKRTTKTQIRTWMRRCREDLRNLELALAAENDIAARSFAEDLSGSAAETQRAVLARYFPEDWDYD